MPQLNKPLISALIISQRTERHRLFVSPSPSLSLAFSFPPKLPAPALNALPLPFALPPLTSLFSNPPTVLSGPARPALLLPWFKLPFRSRQLSSLDGLNPIDLRGEEGEWGVMG